MECHPQAEGGEEVAPQREFVAGHQKADDVVGKRQMSDTAPLSPLTNAEMGLRGRKQLGQSLTANRS